jgi:hypothetical protein
MSVYKRLHLMKSLFKATIIFMLLACAMCYQIGWHRSASYTSQVVSDELLEACEIAIERAENSCVD